MKCAFKGKFKFHKTAKEPSKIVVKEENELAAPMHQLRRNNYQFIVSNVHKLGKLNKD